MMNPYMHPGAAAAAAAIMHQPYPMPFFYYPSPMFPSSQAFTSSQPFAYPPLPLAQLQAGIPSAPAMNPYLVSAVPHGKPAPISPPEVPSHPLPSLSPWRVYPLHSSGAEIVGGGGGGGAAPTQNIFSAPTR